MRKIEAEDGDVCKDDPKERPIEREGKAERGLALPRIARPEAETADADDCRYDGGGLEDEPHIEADRAFERGKADERGEKQRDPRKPARDPAYREEVGFLPLQKMFHRLFAPRGGELFFAAQALSADELVARHAVKFCKYGQHGDVGAGSARLPARYRLVGDAEGIRDFLLGISF